MAALLSLLVITSGCSARAIDQRADLQVVALQREAERAAAYTTCGGRRELGPNCGLLSSKLTAEPFRRRFRDGYCRNRSADECQQRYDRTVASALRDRYPSADFGEVRELCDANILECDDPSAYERHLVDSHNERILAWTRTTEGSIESNRTLAKLRHNERIDGALREIGFALHRGLKCRSYASAFHGVTNTICTEGTKK